MNQKALFAIVGSLGLLVCFEYTATAKASENPTIQFLAPHEVTGLSSGPKDTSPETTAAIFKVIAPFLGVGLLLAGVWALVVFWDSVKRRGVVKQIRSSGPRSICGTQVGDDVWIRGTVSTKRVVTHPFEDRDCVCWSVKATYLVREKISNDAGYEDVRKDLFRASAGKEAVIESEGERAVVAIDDCDYRTLEGEEYTAEELPEPLRAWLRKRGVDLDAKGLEVDALYMPVGAEISAVGHVSSIKGYVHRLDDTGPTGLALSVGGLDEYIDNLSDGLLSTLLLGLGFLFGGFLLVGRLFFS